MWQFYVLSMFRMSHNFWGVTSAGDQSLALRSRNAPDGLSASVGSPGDEDPTVADLASRGRLPERFDRRVHELVGDGELELGLGQEADAGLGICLTLPTD